MSRLEAVIRTTHAKFDVAFGSPQMAGEIKAQRPAGEQEVGSQADAGRWYPY
ncbi:MAG: hypothetical protein ING75_16765 [Rhodocyclaceae bacterium]|nr:hypothetical protein [Rhodocyclaceae bacterium]